MNRLFRLIATYEFTIDVGEESVPSGVEDDHEVPVRLELFRDVGEANMHRARIWRLQHYRLQSTFPQKGGGPKDDPSDERILVEEQSWTGGELDAFTAESDEAALGHPMERIRSFWRFHGVKVSMPDLPPANPHSSEESRRRSS